MQPHRRYDKRVDLAMVLTCVGVRRGRNTTPVVPRIADWMRMPKAPSAAVEGRGSLDNYLSRRMDTVSVTLSGILDAGVRLVVRTVPSAWSCES